MHWIKLDNRNFGDNLEIITIINIIKLYMSCVNTNYVIQNYTSVIAYT